MKVCNKCKKEKSFEEFGKNKIRKDGLQDYCKQCKSEVDKIWWNKNNNGERWKKYYNQKGKEQRIWFKELKQQYSCKKCGDKRWYILDFHHLDPLQKELNIGEAVNTYSKKTILKEILKCIPLCSNCHREFHYLKKENNILIEQYLNNKF